MDSFWDPRVDKFWWLVARAYEHGSTIAICSLAAFTLLFGFMYLIHPAEQTRPRAWGLQILLFAGSFAHVAFVRAGLDPFEESEWSPGWVEPADEGSLRTLQWRLLAVFLVAGLPLFLAEARLWRQTVHSVLGTSKALAKSEPATARNPPVGTVALIVLVMNAALFVSGAHGPYHGAFGVTYFSGELNFALALTLVGTAGVALRFGRSTDMFFYTLASVLLPFSAFLADFVVANALVGPY